MEEVGAAEADVVVGPLAAVVTACFSWLLLAERARLLELELDVLRPQDLPAQPSVKGTKNQDRYGQMYPRCMTAPIAKSMVKIQPAGLLGL